MALPRVSEAGDHKSVALGTVDVAVTWLVENAHVDAAVDAACHSIALACHERRADVAEARRAQNALRTIMRSNAGRPVSGILCFALVEAFQCEVSFDAIGTQDTWDAIFDVAETHIALGGMCDDVWVAVSCGGRSFSTFPTVVDRSRRMFVTAVESVRTRDASALARGLADALKSLTPEDATCSFEEAVRARDALFQFVFKRSKNEDGLADACWLLCQIDSRLGHFRLLHTENTRMTARVAALAESAVRGGSSALVEGAFGLLGCVLEHPSNATAWIEAGGVDVALSILKTRAHDEDALVAVVCAVKVGCSVLKDKGVRDAMRDDLKRAVVAFMGTMRGDTGAHASPWRVDALQTCVDAMRVLTPLI